MASALHAMTAGQPATAELAHCWRSPAQAPASAAAAEPGAALLGTAQWLPSEPHWHSARS